MTNAEEQLATIGFGRGPREAVRWQCVRLGMPAPRRRRGDAVDPADSGALALWREVLARDPRPSPYRIRRLAG